jgi:hypothetical protein
MTADSLRFTGEAIPYTYLGDSHAGAVGSLVFEDPAAGTRIVTRTCGIWRFVAADVLGPDGAIGNELVGALRTMGALHSSPAFPPLPGFRPVQTTYGREKRPEHLALVESANERAYVLCVGEIDTRYILHRFATEAIDFTVPFATEGLEALPAFEPRQTLRADRMLTFLGDELKPLFVGLRVLYAAGSRSLFLHALPPPTIDDADAEKVFKHPSSARLRYKLAMFVNYLYEAVCRDIGIGFINTWPMVTERNLLRPEFYLDGLHLNREHAKLSVREVHRHMLRLKTPVS